MKEAQQPAEAPVFQLPVDVRVGPGPDGSAWVMLTVQDTHVTATVRVPPAAADTLAAGIGGALLKAATAARRQGSGLLVAGQLPADDTLTRS